MVGQKVTIEYYATLNENANIGTVEGNVNKVQLKFDRHPTNKGEGDVFPPTPNEDDPYGESEEIVVKVYTTKIQINKVDGSNNDTMLPGAQFRIEGTSLNKVVVAGYKFVEDEEGAY